MTNWFERREIAAAAARQALLDLPELTNQALAQLCGAGETTVQRVRLELAAAGAIPPPRPRGVPAGYRRPPQAHPKRDRCRQLAITNPGLGSPSLARLAGCGQKLAQDVLTALRTDPPSKREQAVAWAAAYPDAGVMELASVSGVARSYFRGLRQPGGNRPQGIQYRTPALFPQAGQGLCSRPGADPEWWTGEDFHGNKRAVAICQACPVRQACLDWALSIPVHLDYLVWGGTTASQRQRLRRQTTAA